MLQININKDENLQDACNIFISALLPHDNYDSAYYHMITMIENRIREIRTSHGLSQEALATIIDSTQQSISRMENNTQAITAKALIMMSEYFNVSTGYLLGISDIKRDLNGQMRMNQEMEDCYDIVLHYRNLTETNKKTLSCILKRLEQAQLEEKELYIKDVGDYAKDSYM